MNHLRKTCEALFSAQRHEFSLQGHGSREQVRETFIVRQVAYRWE